MKALLDDYSREVKEVSRKSCKSTSKETAQRLKNTSARKTGEYAAGWTSKQLDSDTSVTYNNSVPGLTHLLERGHMIVNKKGTYGRVEGDHKIKEAETWGANELVSKIERWLQ